METPGAGCSIAWEVAKSSALWNASEMWCGLGIHAKDSAFIDSDFSNSCNAEDKAISVTNSADSCSTSELGTVESVVHNVIDEETEYSKDSRDIAEHKTEYDSHHT